MKRKGERLITYQKIEAFGQWLESCERSMETVKKYRHYSVYYTHLDANQELVDTYNVGGIPVVVIFRNGKEVLRFNGEMDYDDLCDILDRPLEKA